MLKTLPFNFRFVLKDESGPDMKLLLGKAFLMEMERGDTEKMVLFARAFLIHALRNGSIVNRAS